MAEATHKSNPTTLPPQAEGHWLTGNYPDLQRGTLQFMTDLHERYGDVVRTRFLFWDAYFVFHPDAVQHALQSNHRNYNKQFVEYEKLGWIVGNGLLTSDGDFWFRQRRLVAPAFHRQNVANYGKLMVEATQEMLEEWKEAAATRRPLDVSKEMMRLTLRIVSEALFSFDSEEDAARVDRAFTIANEYVGVDANRPFSEYTRHVPTSRNRQFKAAVAELDDVVYRIINARRRDPKLQEKGDLLSMLMSSRDEETGEGMTDRQLRDEVMTLLLAGHETTANALTWTFYLLSENPEAREKLQAEVDALPTATPSVDEMKQLPYTKMVFDESMRLYPPAYSIGRVAIAEDEVCGYRIPQGTPVLMSSYVTHRHPDFWDEPESFRPERFAPEAAQERHKFAYFPFGGGPRICIGNSFALLEGQIILANVARRFRLDLVPGHKVDLEPLITLRPRHGMKMTLTQR